MNLEEYTLSVLWKNIDYDWIWGSQCVDLIKNYTNTVLDIRLWTFWGSAKTGWANESNTFPTEQWDKIFNDFNQPNQIPEAWDIIFWNTWEYWHTAIVTDAYWNWIEVLEQNVWNWDWYWADDAVKISIRNYTNILGWFKLRKENIHEVDIVEENERLIAENQKLTEENSILTMKILTARKILEK